ncbi:MAG: guanylate kinase [Bacteroidales bacterium]|jgi:guanylate kinase|nr:guanylate kinase [Bacteroidales bacterium]
MKGSMCVTGKLIIFSAPSGTGKTTIVRHLLQSDLPLAFSVSATSRQMRQNEIEGKDYYFFSPEVFREKIKNEEFLEWEEVYPNQFYGTLFSEINRIGLNGKHTLFDVDVIGGLNIKNKYPAHSLALFLMPPSLEVLKERLIRRGTETEASLNKRKDKAEYELRFADKFDKIIINDDLETTKKEVYNIIKHFLFKENYS